MTAISDCAINGQLTRPRGQGAEDFFNHDWAVCASRGFSRGDNFCDCIRIMFGIVLFVLMFKTPRMPAWVAFAAAVWQRAAKRRLRKRRVAHHRRPSLDEHQ